MNRRHFSLIVAALVQIAVVQGCTSANDGGAPPAPSPAIGLTLSLTGASIRQGVSAPTTATVTGFGGFTGAVSLSTTDVPAGTTATITNTQTSGGVTTATVTVAVSPTAVLGTYIIVVHASGSGVADAVANFTLTVAPPV
ncbi:MAG: hypothetical protein ABJF01_06910 [bacterium]